MKNLILCVLVLFAGSVGFGQNDDSETDSQKRMTAFSNAKRHEVSLDVISALAFPAFNPRYEYVLSKYSGLGIDVNINFDNENDTDEVLEKFSITPYYRQYFFSKEDYGAKGFYAEGFLKAHSYNESTYFWNGNTTIKNEESYFDMAIGVGIGWKWVSKSGFLVDLGFGLGRNFGFADNPNEERDFVGRGGLNFGWRF